MCWKNLFLVLSECLEVFASGFTCWIESAVKCEGSVPFGMEGFQLSRLSVTSVSIWPVSLGGVDGWRKGCRG